MKNNIDFRKGYDLCMQHISQLTQDADLLANKGSYCNAIFLYFTAMEEAVKAFYYAGIHAKLFQYEDIRPYLMNHLPKTGFFLMTRLGEAILQKRHVPARTPSRDEYIEAMKAFYESIPEFKSIREDCLYVDLEDNEWSNPLDVNEEDFGIMKDYVTKFIPKAKSMAEAFFEIPREKQKEFRTMISEILISGVTVYVENLYKSKILTKEQCERIRLEIEREIEEWKKQVS